MSFYCPSGLGVDTHGFNLSIVQSFRLIQKEIQIKEEVYKYVKISAISRTLPSRAKLQQMLEFSFLRSYLLIRCD